MKKEGAFNTMYIQNIKIKNYRNFNDFNMNFQDGLNVVIGSNNSGKTNLLKAIVLLNNPDTITINDFNKNNIAELFLTDYKENPPVIEIEYQIHHSITESDTTDESIIKLISFLGLDKIEEQKGVQEDKTSYNIIANIKMQYELGNKHIENYRKNVKNADTLEKYLDVLEVSLKNYKWTFTNGLTTLEADKKDVINIFKIDFIEAERTNIAIYTETRKAINEFIKDEQNAQALQTMKQEISVLVKAQVGVVLEKISTVVEQEKNEIGLEKGNIAISQDIRPNTAISESYVIDVKDTKSGCIIPLSHNGVGYNNLVNMYMLIKLVDIRKGKDFRILCLEEPEAHLHPAMQYKLFSYLKKIDEEDNLKQQIFVTTHSSNITAVAGLDNMYMLDYKRKDGICDCVQRSLKIQFAQSNDSKKHLMKFLDVTRSDMLFANKVILVEGIAEKLLLPKLMEKVCCSYEDEHISIVEIGGKHFKHFIKVFADNPIDKKVLCITDKDYSLLDDNDQIKPLSEYLTFIPTHVKEIKEGLKANLNIDVYCQTGYGRTFEDELFLSNIDNCLIACKMLRIALSDSFVTHIDSNCLSFDKWNKNKESIDGRSRKKVEEYLGLFENGIKKYPADSDMYQKLFFANLFLHYSKSKKGDVALQILTDDNLINNISVPEYITEGLKWLLK